MTTNSSTNIAVTTNASNTREGDQETNATNNKAHATVVSRVEDKSKETDESQMIRRHHHHNSPVSSIQCPERAFSPH